MKPDDPLLRILACPLDKGPLHLLPATATASAAAAATAGKDGAAAVDGPEESLYNPRLRRRYPIIDGIPQLLPSSGEQVSDEEHETLLARVAENHTTAGDTAGDHMAGDDTGRPGAPGTAA
ncbi:Trm112 family protein [Streptomyces sp. MAR25Y5]|uniref:Trm112 family protein n=1 Tax=Streptomyces sp. MAR25Y5 TaxID=2962028 RepID=UPI0020B7EC3B|nr:Trm112 family protein [Streptomyces sp. MAR25Y5]MCP3765586.1 Trm112 family protein [Streptomyces sp. MAR25Y5]